MKYILIIFLFLFSLPAVNAQEEDVSCEAFEDFQAGLAANPSAAGGINTYLADILTRTVRILSSLNHPDLHQSPVTIPVVVHIVHKNSSEEFTNAEIKKVIKQLTYLFRKKNTSDINRLVPRNFRRLAMDSYIEFKLAKRKPNGDATNGITRRPINGTTYPNFTRDGMKSRSTGGTDAWDTNKYLNIWVGDIVSSDGGDGLLGVGTFPENPYNHSAHGIVMDYTAFAIEAPNAHTPPRTRGTHNEGKTLAHEVGHFLGLRHIWGDSDNDDFVRDTPPANGKNRGCPANKNGSPVPSSEMSVNYMDYTHHRCQHMFTRGQIARMLANLQPGGIRASLLTSSALLPTNLQERNHAMELAPERSNWPSWKVSLFMTFHWLFDSEEAQNHSFNETETEVDRLMAATNMSLANIHGLPQEIANYVYGLAYEVEEVLMCYTPGAFYDIMQRPGVIMSVGSSAADTYALVVKGIGYHEASNTTYLRIMDPLNIGPRGFSFRYTDLTTEALRIPNTGSEYVVDYQKFMTEALEKAVMNNKKIYFMFPPGSRRAIN